MTELLVNYKHKNIISQKSKIHRNIILFHIIPSFLPCGHTQPTLVLYSTPQSMLQLHQKHTGLYRKYSRGRQASIFSYIRDSNGGTLACPCVSSTCTPGQNLAFIHRRETTQSIHTNSRKQSQIQPQQLSHSYFNNRL